MHVKKMVSLVEARTTLSSLTKAVAKGGGAVAITRRSQLASSTTAEEGAALSGLMEITGAWPSTPSNMRRIWQNSNTSVINNGGGRRCPFLA